MLAVAFCAIGISSASWADEARQAAISAVQTQPLLLAQAGAKPAAPNPQTASAALEALIKAAKAEGELTYYSAQTENVPRRVSAAFQAKYGIQGKFIRLNSTLLQQRYATDAEAGTFPADAFLSGDTIGYADAGIKKGWIEAIATAGLPVILSGEFPAPYNRGATAVLQVLPWGIVYNTEKVKGADIPKDWMDLLNPKWKDQILIPNPRSSDSYIDHWAMLFDKYGESYFAKLRAQNLRMYTSGVPAMQALGAGEGSIQVPGLIPQTQGIKEKGAPINITILDMAVGLEMAITLTARGKSKSPHAARLFANYVMSKEGNEVFNADPGQSSIYAAGALPKDYRAPIAGTAGRRNEIFKLLGAQ